MNAKDRLIDQSIKDDLHLVREQIEFSRGEIARLLPQVTNPEILLLLHQVKINCHLTNVVALRMEQCLADLRAHRRDDLSRSDSAQPDA